MSETNLEKFCQRIGKDLKNMRIMRGYSQTMASEKVGISRRTLCRLEEGDMGVSLGTVVSLARLYDAPDAFLSVVGNSAKRSVAKPRNETGLSF